MSAESLASAIYAELSETLNNLSDRFVRLDVPFDWPVSNAIDRLSKDYTVRLLVSRPFKVEDFKGVETTFDGGVATQWRNQIDTETMSIILGNPRGRLVDGLRDVSVVSKREIVVRWQEQELAELRTLHDDLKKSEAGNLLRELFEGVSLGIVDGNRMAAYLKAVREAPSVKTVTENLYMVGLLEDAKALDTRVSSERVHRNQGLVDSLSNSDDPRIDIKLNKVIRGKKSSESDVSLAKQLKRFRDSKELSELKGADLADVERILQDSAPSVGARGISFPSLLDAFCGPNNADVSSALKQLADEWKKQFDENKNIEIVFPLNGVSTKLTLKADNLATHEVSADEIRLSRPWTQNRTEQDGFDQAVAFKSSSQEPVGANEDDDQKLLNPTWFRDRLKDFPKASAEFENYTSARGCLAEYEPWLDKLDLALVAMIIFEDLRERTRNFLYAWNAFVSEVIKLDDAAALLYGAQVLETVQHDNGEEVPEWIVLGPFHPFRLDPLFQVGQFVSSELARGQEAAVVNLGKAMEWLIDRCHPAYPTMHHKGSTFGLSSTNGSIVYALKPKRHLPSARDSSGLDQLFRSFIGFSPWYEKGLGVLVVDCPQGGGVAKALATVARRISSENLSVYELATSDQADSLAVNYDGRVTSLGKVGSLADANTLPPVNVTLRFVSETQASSESASAGWEPTKGAHLTFEIVEGSDDPFSSNRIAKIKIDPNTKNFAVLRTHELYTKFKGGSRPEVATIRPLFETDERPVLSSLAGNTDWLVFAAPGPLGLVAPETINKTLRYVGKTSMGQYGLYAYASDDLFSVRKNFESYITETPVATIPTKSMVDLLTSKAKDSGNAVLMSSTAGVQAELAALVALHVGRDGSAESDQIYTLSLDDFGWTGAWLGPGIRADYLQIRVTQTGVVHIRVIESKSATPGPKVSCDPQVAAFANGISQVQKTLAALNQVFYTEEPTLDEDLRFASLIEQFMAIVLSKSLEMSDTQRIHVFEIVNRLSSRKIKPTLDGLVVLTQAGVSEDRQEQRISDTIRIVSVGRREVERALGIPSTVRPVTERPAGSGGVTGVALPATTPSAPAQIPGVETTGRPGRVQRAEGGVGASGSKLGGTKSTTETPLSPTEEIVSAVEVSSSVPEEFQTLAKQLISAAALQKVDVDGTEPEFVLDGPSLITIGVKLREGSSIQPFRARLPDIARDIGMGDKADFIQVENDSQPRTVRVILPRPVKNIPCIPAYEPTPVTGEGYLPIYIGQTVDGKDYSTTVESWPHMLVAGSTGSGKTTLLKTILIQLSKYAGEYAEFLIADGKGETDYMNLIPEFGYVREFPDVQLGAESALRVLEWAVEEMERRRQFIVDLFKKTSSATSGLNAITLFKEAVAQGKNAPIKPLVVVVDEFADIIISSKKNAERFENLVQRISQVGRSRMIHLLLATQRPDKETIRGAIKANLNARVVLQLPTQADSMTVLGQSGAEKLLRPGDFLFQRGSGSLVRLQGYKI